MEWPQTEIEKVTEEQYNDLMSRCMALPAAEVTEFFLKIKLMMRVLLKDGVITTEMAQACEPLCDEFIRVVRAEHQPEAEICLDDITSRLIGFILASCMTPGAIVKYEKLKSDENVH